MGVYSQWWAKRPRRVRVSDDVVEREVEKQRRTRAEHAFGHQLEDPRWSSVQALVGAALLTVFVLSAIVAMLLVLTKPWGQVEGASAAGDSEEAALSLVFVATAVILILVVCTLTIVFKRLNLVDSTEAMGLPRGCQSGYFATSHTAVLYRRDLSLQ